MIDSTNTSNDLVDHNRRQWTQKQLIGGFMRRGNLKIKHTPRPPAMPPAKTFLFVLANVAASFRKRPKSTVDSPCERINLCRPSVLTSSLSSGTFQLRGGSNNTTKQSLYSITYWAQGMRSITQTLQDTSLLLSDRWNICLRFTCSRLIFVQTENTDTGFEEESSCGFSVLGWKCC